MHSGCNGSLGSGRKAPSVLLIFPGQGSQCPRMGEGLYRGEPAYRAHVDRLCVALTPLLGFDLRAELYPSAEREAEAGYLPAFNSPLVTQPAIFVTELALGYTLLDYGVVPSAVAGHSIGEFAAATCAAAPRPSPTPLHLPLSTGAAAELPCRRPPPPPLPCTRPYAGAPVRPCARASRPSSHVCGGAGWRASSMRPTPLH